VTHLRTAARPDARTEKDREQAERHEPLPTWRNTRPRGNPEPDRQDVERGRERLEALLGR
jgi:hypothetical protein